MNAQTTFLSGMLAGAGLMYILDPDRGRRRRALLRDQVAHGAHELEDLGQRLSSKSVDLRNRARGAIAETRARSQPERVDDDVLVARVRSGIGRAVSNAGGIVVTARGGHVTLSGPVLEHEAAQLLAHAESVRGVVSVEDALDRHAQAGAVPALQNASSTAH